MLPATVAVVGPAGVQVTLPSGAALTVAVESAPPVGTAVSLGVRPEALLLDAAGPLAGTVRLVERLGGMTLLHVSVDGCGSLTVQTDGADATRPHEAIRLSVDATAAHLFGPDGLALPRSARHPLAA